LNSNQIIEYGMPPLLERNGGNLSVQENDIRPQSPIHEGSQPVNKICPQSLVPEHAVSSYVQDPILQRDSGSNSLHTLGPIPLRERGGYLTQADK